MWKYFVVYFVYQYTLLPQCEWRVGNTIVHCAVAHVDTRIDTCDKTFDFRKDAVRFMDSLNKEINQNLPVQQRPVLDSFKVNL